MSATQPQTQPVGLPPATLNAMICTTMDTLPHHPRATANEVATRREAAYLVIEALRPRDPLESMLATRVVATHYHAMHNLGCATQHDLPPDLQLRFQGRAVALSRLMDATLNTLFDRQTAAPRRVAGLPAAVAPSAQAAPEAAHAAAPDAPPAAPEVVTAPGVVAAPAPVVPAQDAPAPAAEAADQAAAALTAKVPPAAPAPAARQAHGSPFAAHAAMEARLLAEAAAQMATSLDALLPLAA